MNIKRMTLVGMFAALLAIISPLQIILPFSPVPITLQVAGVALTASILGSKLGTLSVIIYILLGVMGLPVFAGLTSGIPRLIGPTGGYILGFVLSAYLIGRLLEEKRNPGYLYVLMVNVLGLLVVYLIGTTQLSLTYTHSFTKALAAGVIPYIIPDLIKLGITSIIVVQVQRVLTKSNLLIL